MSAATLRNLGMRPDVITLGDEMGRVTTEAKFENLNDLWEERSGARPSAEVRRVAVPDALVDTGCTLVGLPHAAIEQLGLMPLYKRSVRGATGSGETTVYGTVRLTIGDRFCQTDVMEIPDGIPVLIGQVPLELLDYVVDLNEIASACRQSGARRRAHPGSLYGTVSLSLSNDN